MIELYRLILENAPLSRLVSELSALLGTSVELSGTSGNVLAASGEPAQEGAVCSIPLVWKGERAGTLRLGEDAKLPEVLLCALAALVHKQSGREPALEARLFFALRNGGEDLIEPSRKNEPDAYVLFYADANELEEDAWPTLFSELTAIHPEALSAAAFYAGAAALIFRHGACAKEGLSDALNGVLQKYGVAGALSQPFDGRQLAKQLELTRLTILAGSRLYPEQKLYRFEALASFVFFLVAQRNLKLSNYHDEDVLQIIHHDYEKGTDLSRSLYVYLFYFMDLKEAAKEVRVHRNTLDYQIKKIGQILGKLPDPDKRFEMMCTYGMLAMEQPE